MTATPTDDIFYSARQPKLTCAIDECIEVATSRGWCARHYSRWRRYGDPLAPVRRRCTVWETPLDPWLAKHGMTTADLDVMWAAQDGLCAICAVPLIRTGRKTVNIDHCHATGRIRGLLCRPCNQGIGLMSDDPNRLEQAARYLRSGG